MYTRRLHLVAHCEIHCISGPSKPGVPSLPALEKVSIGRGDVANRKPAANRTASFWDTS
jgi:hypothetical protein